MFLYLCQTSKQYEEKYPAALTGIKRLVRFNFGEPGTLEVRPNRPVVEIGKTSFAQGRGEMLKWALSNATECSHVVFVDSDITMNFAAFEAGVLASGKSVVFPRYVRYPEWSYEQIMEAGPYSGRFMDQCVIAVRIEFLPKFTIALEFHDTNWWASGLMSVGWLWNEHRNEVEILKQPEAYNLGHEDHYPRSANKERLLDMMEKRGWGV